MYKENVQSILDNSVLISELKKNFTEFSCYKLGIIDSNGNKIRQPVTEEEQLSYSPLTRTILRVKKYLGPKTDLLDVAQTFSKDTVGLHESVEQHKKIIHYRERFDSLVNEMYRVIEEAQHDGVPSENIKKIIRA